MDALCIALAGRPHPLPAHWLSTAFKAPLAALSLCPTQKRVHSLLFQEVRSSH